MTKLTFSPDTYLTIEKIYNLLEILERLGKEPVGTVPEGEKKADQRVQMTTFSKG